MRKGQRIAGTCLLALLAAVCTVPVLAQEEHQKKERPSGEGHRGEARQERKEAPAAREERPTRTERQETPQARPQPQQQVQRQNRPEVRPETPAQPHQAAPVQPRPAAPAGRTFGNPPASHTTPAYRPPAHVETAAPGRVYTTRTGDVIRRDTRGQVTQVRMTNGTTIYRTPNAPQRVEVVRPGGHVIVAGPTGRGYVQRPVVVQNTTIIKRTYVYNGVPQARFYRPRVYGGVTLAVYTPVHYYHPAFYAWAWNPWPRPIYYSWGWGGSPWYSYYGPYFAPYPYYAGPAFWLTDFMIASTLQAAYADRMAADRAYAASQYPADQTVAMTPEVKQAISDEVRFQIGREMTAAQNPTSMNADDGLFGGGTSHVFVVSTPLLVNSNQGDCTVHEGDVLQLPRPPQANSTNADVVVMASRPGGCQKGATAYVPLQDLQEMANQMRATLDRGMQQLQSQQGQNGVPPLPAGAAGLVDTPLAAQAQPDPDSAQQINEANREADQQMQQVVAQGSGAPPVLTLGMSLDQVRSIQGDPDKIVDLGEKKIYVYKDLKITFQDSKVTDIQ